ncbi:MAG: alpha/beta hydrolase [Leptolyngbyaceae bacterium]|nr:alpha/beta hydrolase [Leptolyngbyaceae bacterium]
MHNLSIIPDANQTLAQSLTEERSIAMFQQIQRMAIATPITSNPITTTYVGPPKSLEIPMESGTPILLLHGFDSSLLEFRRLLPLLQQQQSTWAIDLLGFGFTQRSPELTFTPTAIQQHLYHTWQTLIGQPMILVGASMGGAVALDFCLTYPEAVAKLVLLDSAGMAQAPDMSKMMVPPLGLIAAEFLRNPWVRQNISRAAYFDKSLASADALTCSRLHTFCPGWRRAMIAFTRSGGYTFFSESVVKSIACPTLIIWGRNDEILGTADAETFAGAIANSQLKWCDRCGHVPHLEQPEQTAEYILNFV